MTQEKILRAKVTKTDLEIRKIKLPKVFLFLYNRKIK